MEDEKVLDDVFEGIEIIELDETNRQGPSCRGFLFYRKGLLGERKK